MSPAPCKAHKDDQVLRGFYTFYHAKIILFCLFYILALFLQLFCGLRPCEVETARIENGFVVAKNAKRKGGKTEYKRIPIPAEADLTECKANTQRSNIEFKKLFPARTQYDLRHTFSTVCQMYVRREIVEIWLGDSSEKLIGNTYTHFSDDFMRSGMSRVRFL